VDTKKIECGDPNILSLVSSVSGLWLMSVTWLNMTATHCNTLLHTYCGLCLWHDSTWLIPTSDMTHSCMCGWRCWVGVMSPHCKVALLCVCDTTHSCMQTDSFMCATWLIHVCNMTPIYVAEDTGYKSCPLNCKVTLLRVCDMTWLLHVYNMSHSCMRHDLCICGWRHRAGLMSTHCKVTFLFVCDMIHW